MFWDKSTINNKLQRHKWLIILCSIFICSVVVRGILGDFPKALRIYPDELRYLGIARSLFDGDGLRFHNLDSNFQKILYSVCIMPAFLFRSSVVQIRVVGYINSLIVASSIFPTYRLCRKLLGSDKEVVGILLFWITFPTLLVSIYFMSEVTFLSISLWIVYCVWSILCTEKFIHQMSLNLLLGVLIYLAYLNKEIALYFLISYGLICVIRIFLRRTMWRTELVSLAMAIVTFASCFFLMKATLFCGLNNSYSDWNLHNIRTLQLFSHPEKIVYLVYAVSYDTIFAILAFGVFPITIPLVVFRKKDKESLLYLFLLFSLLIGCVAIAYTITLPEEFGSRSPKQHLRYLEPLIIPFLILLISGIKKFDKLKQTPESSRCFKVLVICTVIFSILFIVLGSGGGSALVDNTTLVYYEYFARFIAKSDVIMLLVRIIMVAVFGIGLFVFDKRPSTFIRLFCILFIALNLINSAVEYAASLYRYRIEGEQRAQASEANDYLKALQGNILLISKEGLESEDNRLFDTYVCRDFYVTEIEILEEDHCLDDSILDLNTEYVRCVYPKLYYQDLKEVDYIVVKDSYDIRFQESSVKEFTDFPMDGYSLYRNYGVDKIYFR